MFGPNIKGPRAAYSVLRLLWTLGRMDEPLSAKFTPFLMTNKLVYDISAKADVQTEKNLSINCFLIKMYFENHCLKGFNFFLATFFLNLIL